MTQRERDRLVALKKADKKLITQKQAAQQLGLSERQLRRLLAKLRSQGDHAVIHAAWGRASNRKISAKVEKRALAILSQPLYAGFGPTLAAEYLQQRHCIQSNPACKHSGGCELGEMLKQCSSEASCPTGARLAPWRRGLLATPGAARRDGRGRQHRTL